MEQAWKDIYYYYVLFIGRSALFTKAGLQAVLSRTNYGDISEPKPGGHVYSLEGHHNGPHRWTGGHLSGRNTAPYDPVFYMHHAYVDAVWQRFREQQVRNGINPETDYLANPASGHGIDDIIDFRPYVNVITNRLAMSNFIADLITYEPFPSCENQCNRSPDLTCVNNHRSGVPVCVSRALPPQEIFAFAQRMPDVPVEPIPAGEKFAESPFRDLRNREETIGTAPIAPEILMASTQVRSRRDVSNLSKNESSHHNRHQSISSITRSFSNTFILDGVVDPKRWVYVPVRIVYARSPNVKGSDPTLLGNSITANDICPTVNSGASKVFVASDGLNYYGNYEEFGIIDERQPFSITTTAVGVKNPDFGDGEVLFTAYDSCGRPCHPLCLTTVNGQQKYKGCSGAFKISSAAPAMYKYSYKEALSSDLSIYNLMDSALEGFSPPLTIVCGNKKIWPWKY